MIKQYIKHLLFLLVFMLSINITAQAQEGADYKTTIKSADEYYQNKDYYNAKASYQLASKINPAENYPKEKIAEIIALLKAEMAVRGSYDGYIETADEAFESKDYQLAITNYEKALELIAYESHPQQQLKKAQDLYEAAQLKQSIYNEAITKADQHFVNEEYEQALSFYRDAASVDDSQKYPNDQIIKISNILHSQNANQIAYEQAIQKADQQLNYQKFAEALAQYEQALEVKPNDNYALSQVAKMKDFIQKEKEYDRIAENADKLYVNKNFVAAKVEYEKAQGILPEKTYALNMISKIDASLDEAQKEVAKAEADYQKTIAEADVLFKEEKYQVAYSKYAKAMDMKPDAEYPKSRLLEIDILLATGYFELSCFVHEDNRGLFDSKIQLIEGGRVVEILEIGTSGKEKLKLELNREYQLKVSKADYIQKIFNINTALPKEVNHNNIFEYDLSVELFQSCATDLSIFDNALLEIEYFESKGNFYYDEKRARVILNKINALENECEEILKKEKKQSEYDDLITKADNHFNRQDYPKAIEEYTGAATILPTEQYPKQKVAEIKSIIAETDKYQSLIISADAKYKAKDYENALYDYYAAKNLKPNETYPPKQIAEIDLLLNAQKELDASYLAKIGESDSLFQLDSLSMAISSYELASDIKPTETYPKNQIVKIEDLLANKEALDKKYKNAIANADDLFEAEKLNDAKAAYLIASQIKPNEMYPKYKIEDINTIEEQRRIMALNSNYAEVLADADEQFGKLAYTNALPLYERASEIKPKEGYPKEQIQKIATLMAQIQADEERYNSLIASADKSFLAKEYAPAFDDYKLSLQIKPTEEYPQNKMAEIEAIMKELADLELAYQEAIRQADDAYGIKEWNNALGFYQQASGLKIEEQYPKDKILEINGLLKGMADSDAAYAAAVSEADRRFESAEWTLSLTSYQRALEIKAAEAYPETKIAEINAILKEIEDKQAAYNTAIASADELFNTQSYTESKSYYQQASSIKPIEEYPKTRITEIDALLKQMANQDALYAQLIESGDGLFTKKNYQQSLSEFKQAQSIKPNEAYPPQKITEIEGILLAIAEQERKYTEAIAAADRNRDTKVYAEAISKYTEASSIKPEEEYPINQIAALQSILAQLANQQNAYDQLISQANAEFDKKQWRSALGFYKESLTIKANETYPKTRITEIEGIIQEIAEQNAAYNKAIDDADAFYKTKNWESSLTNYELATQIKPEESYPQEKIAELKAILGDLASANAQYNAFIADADLLFTQVDYENAKLKYQSALEIKPEEAYPQERILAIDDILAKLAADLKKYNDFIKEADKLFAKKELTPSIEKYQAALSIKPQEAYPQDQINIINATLQGIADKRANYNAQILEADNLFNAKEYENALLKFEAASVILPVEKYPKDKMSEIRDLLAELASKNESYNKIIAEADELLAKEKYEDAKEKYQAASSIFISRPYPQEQITKIDALILKRDEYNQLITLGDGLFKEKKYEESLNNFKQAQSLFPAREYPTKKITEIETILSAIAMTRAAYDEAIRKGDMRFQSQEYELAKENYSEALYQLSSEVYPRQKIMEIDQILQDLARKRVQFDKMIAQADASFKDQSYDMALSKYQSALGIIPDEEYPQQKITEIQGLLAQFADKQTRYDNLVEQGDKAFSAKDYATCINLFEQAMAILPNETYPPEKIAEAKHELALIQRELDVDYQRAITAADRSFSKRKWEDAKVSYQQAADIKPVELYPPERLAEINSILEEELNKQQKKYDRYIADGERFYSTKYYQESIIAFEGALNVFPYEKYPVEMIDKIFELIKKNSMVSILDSKVQILNKQKEKFTFNPIAFKDRSENYILLEVKTVNPEQQVKLYVNFGKADAQNGGYSIHLKNKDGYHRYFVNIGKQPRWVNTDNDYISLLPEGGDVEVKLIKLSRNGI